MNKINRVKFSDLTAIVSLVENENLKYHTELSNCLSILKSAYKEYVLKSGVPDKGMYRELPQEAKVALRYYYSNTPVSHRDINNIRRNDSNSLCPMCGSMHRGTLDHVLPKDNFPEFSVFTRNLVPACKCNNKKGNAVAINVNERILHPYYDNILSQRLISAKISSLSAIPKIDIKILLPDSHELYSSVNYHINTVVKANDIVGYLQNQWEQFYLHPKSVIRGLTQQIDSVKKYFSLLNEEIKLLDEKHGGKNNWNSVFVSGLYSKEVARWILAELCSTKRDTGGKMLL